MTTLFVSGLSVNLADKQKKTFEFSIEKKGRVETNRGANVLTVACGESGAQLRATRVCAGDQLWSMSHAAADCV